LKSIYLLIHIVINNNVYGDNKNMKTNIILIALFVAAFMFPSIRSVDTAEAAPRVDNETPQLPDTIVSSKSETSVHVKSAPPTFDDNLMGLQGTSANRQYGTSYRNELSEKNRMRNGIPGSGLDYSSDASERQMGAESNANRQYGTSYRNELSEKNRMRNGIPGSGRKMK
jgi:hypothetical protein